MAESPRSKRVVVVAGDGGVDRLSALPDELLHSIMSFLMARQTVQTSVLARRWKDLWRSTPCLNIDHHEFAGGGGAALSGCSAGQSAWSKLHDFTSSLLKSHHAPVLEKFQLHVGAYHSAPAVDGWIRRGVRCRPAALEITAANQCGWLTPCLAPAVPCRLTRMSLCRVRLDAGFAKHLRSGCPVLEDLVLTGCHCAFQEVVSNTLRSLTIDCCQCASPSKVSRAVTAPALASFRLIVPRYASHDAFLVNGGCSSGLELQATITVTREDPYGGNKSMSTFRLLGSLCNVTTLELWGLRHRMDVRCLSPMDKEKFPDLHNLSTLRVEKCEMSMQFGLLRLFVKNAPSLERTTLKHCKYSTEYAYAKKYGQRKIAPRYLKLLCYDHYDLKLIGIKYKETNTSNLFGLLMGIRSKLEEYTVLLTRNKLNMGN